MLVIGRRQYERIVISNGKDEIVVAVVRIGGRAVRIGIDASAAWNIRRGELPPPEPRVESVEPSAS